MPSLSFNSFSSMGGSQTAPSSPAISRSNSITSNISQASHKSEPAWFNTYNGVDTTGSRKSSTTSVKTTPASASNEGHGLKSFFSTEGRAERKERKRLEQEKLAKTVLTSRHAAVVRTRMLMEQRNGTTKTANVQGTITSAHITAAAQEARLPHSGPPALHAAPKDNARDMPLLTRIASGDEYDEEDERLQRDREEWLRKKADVTMRRVAEGDDSSSEESVHVPSGQVVEIAGTRVVGAVLDGHKPARLHGLAWTKNEAGMWTR